MKHYNNEQTYFIVYSPIRKMVKPKYGNYKNIEY